MKVGFTGTRKGMSEAQARQLTMILNLLIRARTDVEFHHGAAPGADTEASEMVDDIAAFPQVAHPAGADPLARNKEIITVCHLLIAAPERDEEQLRSGTWATIRYARKAGKPVVMLSRGGQ